MLHDVPRSDPRRLLRELVRVRQGHLDVEAGDAERCLRIVGEVEDALDVDRRGPTVGCRGADPVGRLEEAQLGRGLTEVDEGQPGPHVVAVEASDHVVLVADPVGRLRVARGARLVHNA